ncbi:DNA-binding protein [Dietzia sp. UCD-THP]|nr:DNA-binding protein [Dietzia sp. UCD-THP]
MASAYAKRSPRWIRQRLVDGRLTAFKSGHDDRLVLIDLDELDELLRVRPA